MKKLINRKLYRRICAMAIIISSMLMLLCGCGKISDEPKEYIFPAEWSTWSKRTAEETVELSLAAENRDEFFTSIKANDDGTVSLWLTPAQVKRWESNTKLLKETEDLMNGWIKISYSKDYRTATIYMDHDNGSYINLYVMVSVLRDYLLAAQIASGEGTAEDWSITFTLKNMQTDNTVAEWTMPYEEITIVPEMWDDANAA